jgi:hypothetical protein
MLNLRLHAPISDLQYVQHSGEVGQPSSQAKEAKEQEKSDETAPKGPLVQFARYVDGKVQLFEGHADVEKYIAISHAWGDIGWRWLPSIGREALISEQKAAFVEQGLSSLVGDTAF